ncbi:MAG: hypothetical protein U0263_09450 [Polyangiaceae bacterium]
MRSSVSLSALLGLLTVGVPALADTKAECAKAYESSQEQRSSGKLRAARESLVTCSQAGCPNFIKKDCAKWLSEVEGSIPTVVFSAKAGNADLTDVKVSLGDQTLAESLDGKAVSIDPGTHTFVFESEKYGKRELKFVVKEGQKAQSVEISFEAAGGGKKDVPTEGGTPETPSGGGDSGVKVDSSEPGGKKTLGFVLLGVGAVGVGGFAFFGLTGKSDEKKLDCADSKTCTDSDLDPIKKKYLYADISLGVGLVSLGVGTYLLATSGGGAKQGKTRKLPPVAFDVAPRPGGGFASVFGAF